MKKFLEIIFDFTVSEASTLQYGLCKALVRDLEHIERAIKTQYGRPGTIVF